MCLLASANALADIDKIETLLPVKVAIVEADGKYQLLRGGKPYIVHGAGIHHTDLATFAAHGGNSLRTWTVNNGAEPCMIAFILISGEMPAIDGQKLDAHG